MAFDDGEKTLIFVLIYSKNKPKKSRYFNTLQYTQLQMQNLSKSYRIYSKIKHMLTLLLLYHTSAMGTIVGVRTFDRICIQFHTGYSPQETTE